MFSTLCVLGPSPLRGSAHAERVNLFRTAIKKIMYISLHLVTYRSALRF